MTNELTIPDGWIEREPERFEDRLFVSQDVYDNGLYEGVAKLHVAYYTDGVIEVCNRGRYTFHDAEDTTLQGVLNDVSE